MPNEHAKADEIAARAEPCPFCGERLVVLSDHHGSWVGHKEWPASECFEVVAQLHDERDLAQWNCRSALSVERERR